MKQDPGAIVYQPAWRGRRRMGLLALLLAAVVTARVLIPVPPAPAAPATQSAWPTYLADPARTSASDARIGPLVSPAWTHVVNGFIASEPVIANNRVYVTAWDGYLYALDLFDGHELWRTFLGTYQIKPGCPGSPNLLGITAAPTFDAATNLLYASAMSPTVVITTGSPPRPRHGSLSVRHRTREWPHPMAADVERQQ